MKKLIIFSLIMILLILVGALFLSLFPNYLTANIIKDSYSFTKAICNENNFCQDYEIICMNGKIENVKLTGAAVQFPEDWRDPREESGINSLCE